MDYSIQTEKWLLLFFIPAEGTENLNMFFLIWIQLAGLKETRIILDHVDNEEGELQPRNVVVLVLYFMVLCEVLRSDPFPVLLLLFHLPVCPHTWSQWQISTPALWVMSSLDIFSLRVFSHRLILILFSFLVLFLCLV